MKNIVLTGIGGQGTVLAAKILAQAAQARGWHVRTAETIGMAQRGGSVVSHVRMGDCGERVAAPLVSEGCADMLIAFEPGEGVRMARILKPGGVMVTASRVVQPVTASLSREPYEAGAMLEALRAKASCVKEVARVEPESGSERTERLAGEGWDGSSDVRHGAESVEASNAVGDAAQVPAADPKSVFVPEQASAQETASSISTLYVVNEAPILDRIGNAKTLNIVLLTVAVHAGVLGLTLQEFKDAVAACVKPRFKDMNLAAIDAVEALLA